MTRGRPFQPGQSGNPGGRPKIVGDIRALAREHTPEAIAELVRLATKARREEVRLRAIEVLLDRGYGKPNQSVQIDAVFLEKKLNQLSDAELAELEARLTNAEQAMSLDSDKLN